MPALNTDKLLQVGKPGTATTLASPGHTSGGTSITVGSTTNWPTATAVAFAIDRAELVGGEEVQIPGTYTEWIGVVTGATTIGSMVISSDSPNSDQNYSAGSLTRVYIPVSATRENKIVEWGLVEHNQDGTHRGFTSWTPSLTGITGHTVDYGGYMKIGKLVHFEFKLTLTGANISGNTYFAFPVTPNAKYGESGANFPVGLCLLYDSNGALYNGVLRANNRYFIILNVNNAAGTYLTLDALSATVPFTWATGDTIVVNGTYEAA